VDDATAPLLTDFYQLTMAQAYLAGGLGARATFELFVRTLPEGRNVLVACGLDDALRFLERMRYDRAAVEWLRSLGRFSDAFLEALGRIRFTGDVRAVAEGTPVFAGEPILEVTAPIAEAQLAETFLLNQVHFQTLIASKGARVVSAARGRTVVDFGLRRAHGADAGLRGSRALYVGGVHATSNVLAGRIYGIPLSGTMAHSWVLAHEDEAAAFRTFTAEFPDTVLLVDTFDTLAGVRRVVALARELGGEFRVRGVRLDSGDLASLARESRAILDEAGLQRVEIFVSGGLDELDVRALVDGGAPITGFGVGTRMNVSADRPWLDAAYKLVEAGGHGRMKLSAGKATLPGRKQVFRLSRDGEDVGDLIAREEETAADAVRIWGSDELEARPLLRPVMAAGERLPAGDSALEEARARAREGLARLPSRVLALERADPAYPVEVSPELRAAAAGLRRDLVAREHAP
jgi:nicotinate phosphoribosyltransferase